MHVTKYTCTCPQRHTRDHIDMHICIFTETCMYEHTKPYRVLLTSLKMGRIPQYGHDIVTGTLLNFSVINSFPHSFSCEEKATV